jgi:hypothetical protein
MHFPFAQLPEEVCRKIFVYLSNPVADIIRAYQRQRHSTMLNHVFATDVKNTQLRHDILIMTLAKFSHGEETLLNDSKQKNL